MPETGTQGTQGTGTQGTGTQGTGTQGTGTGSTAPAWHGIAETDTASLQYVQNKGWNSPADVIKSYQGAEKLIGQDPSKLIVVPRADDPTGMLAALDKLGRPASADKYEFSLPADGVKPDEGYMAWARGAFHKVGLLPGQVKELTAAHNEYVKSVLAQQEKDYNLSVEADKKALLGEWKGGHERMMNAAKTAANALGFTPEMIDGIERTIGYAGTWKFMAELGKKLGEDGLVTGGKQNFSATLTPDEAKTQWEASKLDPNFMAALKDNKHPGHAAAQKKQNDLFAIMYPSK